MLKQVKFVGSLIILTGLLFEPDNVFGQNYVTEYSEDFSVDPGWTTDQPGNYFWDSATETYNATVLNTHGGLTSPTRYSYTNIEYDGNSMRLEFDILFDSVGWSAGVMFGLFDQHLNLWPSTIAPKADGIHGSFGVADGGMYITLYVCDSTTGCDIDQVVNVTSDNTWYRCTIEYSTDNQEATLVLRDIASNVVVADLLVSGVAGLKPELDYLGFARDPSGNDCCPSCPGYNCANQATAHIDNVVFSEALNGPWQLATDQAPWAGHANYSSLSFDGKLWIFGGRDAADAPLNDVWSSTDGESWTQVTSAANWAPRDVVGAVVFQNKMWILGGRDSWPAALFNDVWSSTDGIVWTEEQSAAPWSPRYGPAIEVHNGKLWLMGGRDGSYQSDVWSSVDGVTWNLENAAAAWPGSSSHGSAVFDGKLWVMGGWIGGYSNDVYSSSDGQVWSLATSDPGWTSRANPSTLVAEGRMWVIGGSSDYEDPWLFNDVWTTTDGTNWVEGPGSPADWAARTSHAPVVHDNKIWVLGGIFGDPGNTQRMSDVWYLDLAIPPLCNIQGIMPAGQIDTACRASGIVISPDESKLYVACWESPPDGTVARVLEYNLPDLTPLQTILTSSNHGEVVISGDGSRIFFPNYYPDTVTQVELDNANVMTNLSTVNTWPAGISMTPDKTKVIATVGQDGQPFDQGNDSIAIYDITAANFGLLASVQLQDEPQGFDLGVSEDSRFAYVGTRKRQSTNPKLYEISLEAPYDVTRTMEFPETPLRIGATRSLGNRVFVSDAANSKLWIVDRTTWTKTGYALESAPGALEIHPSGAYLFALMPDIGAVVAIDISSMSIVALFDGLSVAANDIEFNNDGTKMYVAHRSSVGEIMVFDVGCGACGNGVVDPYEVCDDGNNLDCDGCRGDCSAFEIGCGDGFVCGAEVCDDGNNADCDGCRADCSATETGCGDGFTCSIEECDDGGESATCDTDCTLVVCGDGTRNMTAGEVCDDGNIVDGDGCSTTCTIECGDGMCDHDGSDLANYVEDNASCPVDCFCGDGILDTTEECDDGNNDDFDGCSALCLIADDFKYRCMVLATPSAVDQTAELPTGISAVGRDGQFVVEFWATDSGPISPGVVSAYVDLDYPEDSVTCEPPVVHSNLFNLFPEGVCDGLIVDELGGSQLASDIGIEPMWARIASANFTADVVGAVDFNLRPATTESSSFGRGLIPAVNIDYGTCGVDVACPCIYDQDDNCNISGGDLGLFAPCWDLFDTDSEWDVRSCTAKDFDCNGRVSGGDLGWFAGSWNTTCDQVDPLADYPLCRQCAPPVFCPGAAQSSGSVAAGLAETGSLNLANLDEAAVLLSLRLRRPDEGLRIVSRDTNMAVQRGDRVSAEVWAKDTSTNTEGLTVVFADVAFDPSQFDVVGVDSGETFTLFSEPTLDDDNGIILQVGGATMNAAVGANEWTHVGTVELEALVDVIRPMISIKPSKGEAVSRYGQGLVPTAQIRVVPYLTKHLNGTRDRRGQE